MQKLLRFPVYYNLILAFGAAFSAYSFSTLFHLPIYDFSVSFLFLGTLAIYNLHKIVKYKRGDYENNLPLKRFCSKNYVLLSLTVMVAGFLLLLIFSKETLHPTFLGLLSACGILSFLYPLRIIPLKGKRLALRELPYLKPYLVALVWATLVIYVRPNFGTDETISQYLLASFLAFLQFFIITSISDVKDMDYDSPTTKTLPQILGRRRFQTTISILNILAVFTLSLCALLNAEWQGVHTAFLLGYGYLFFLGWIAKKNNKWAFFGYALDGMPIIQFSLIMLLT